MPLTEKISNSLQSNPRTWLVTGVAGFIGSNLLEGLLHLGQTVIGLDNFSTGYPKNLEDVQKEIPGEAWKRFRFIEGDIRNLADCHKACQGVDYVLHQAALGSVPRSIDDPIQANQSNVDGFLNMLVASRDEGVKRFVYASSSAVYGDSPDLPKQEEKVGQPLSPYAVTKSVNELYADVFSDLYGLANIGLRYFNVFGKRQDPKGAYAAVIPKWIEALLNREIPTIDGDGETTRDFCYIENIMQANFLSALTDHKEAINKIYNIAFGEQTSLNQLYRLIRDGVSTYRPETKTIEPFYGSFRKGDIRHSLADISKAKNLLGYQPEYDVAQGMAQSIPWYIAQYSTKN
jgi:UDP-N-acetylglucosamine 4-epimerase